MTAHSRDLLELGPRASATSIPDSAQAAPRARLYRDGVKRMLDVALVLATAPVWMTITLVTALLILAGDGRNPFYRQARLGLGGRVFHMWKLRSMVHDADALLEAHLAADPAARAEWDSTQKLKHDPRITRVGRIIRKTSIDELPQLWNVLIGEMSLVGPRPMMVGQRALYHGSSYFALRPGLTGFWQISDRNECRFRDRVRFDDAYESSVSLRTDVTVIFRTVAVVVRGTGY